MAYSRKPSPACLAARSLAKKISEMTEEQKQAFLAKFPAIVTVEGHALAVGNMVMALNQRQDATVVGGFKQWQQAGRQVRQGQKALWIFAPSVKKAETAGEADSVYFRLVPVFDVTQTEDAAEAREQACIEGMLEAQGII